VARGGFKLIFAAQNLPDLALPQKPLDPLLVLVVTL